MLKKILFKSWFWNWEWNLRYSFFDFYKLEFTLLLFRNTQFWYFEIEAKWRGNYEFIVFDSFSWRAIQKVERMIRETWTDLARLTNQIAYYISKDEDTSIHLFISLRVACVLAFPLKYVT